MKHIHKKQMKPATFPDSGKLKMAFNAGLTFFLDYARTHFLTSHYQALLKEFNQIAPSSDHQWVISKELINSIYIVAKQALKDHELVSAKHLFHLLSLITPQQFDVWLGLGLTYQQLQQEEAAIAAFEHAQQLQPHSPLPYLYSAESYVQLKQWQQGYDICTQAASFATPLEKRFESVMHQIQQQCAQQLKGGTR
jgi:tetratricopeptide (TPR) repeat protein